jgi:diguanylate cyclase (GGDEF)-like protein
MWSLNERLMLSTLALLMAGFFHSIMILYPEFMKKDKEISTCNEHRKQLQEQVMIDALTGIHNRRFFDLSLRAYLKEFEGVDARLGLLLFDLDNFKIINDTHGHNAGDQVLITIASILKDNSREHDVVVRLGGDEFAVITNCSDKAQLTNIANRLQREIGETNIDLGKVVLQPKISIGVATNQESNDAKELFELADQRLYQAKRNERRYLVA